MNTETDELNEIPVSTFYRHEAYAPKTYVLVKAHPFEIAKNFSWSDKVDLAQRDKFSGQLADAFWWSFGEPAPVKAGATLAYELDRVTKALNRFVRIYNSLDEQGKAAAQGAAMASAADFNYNFADVMERLTIINQAFADQLALRQALQLDPRQRGGPETDYRVRAIAGHLADIFEEYFGPITMSASADGSYKGRFITFCREACTHFLGENGVSDASLLRAAREEHKERITSVDG